MSRISAALVTLCREPGVTGYPQVVGADSAVALGLDVAQNLGRGADPLGAGLLHRLGKLCGLGQEAVTWMYRVGAGLFHGANQGLNVEVALDGGGFADINRFVRFL